ncbi:MAG TPA: hypothetical protein VLH10_19235 [Yinghuangia sp.]|uniref:hypothetical protein n=1 Tax=Yinghuangia sp. YIM S10712 TaxID=3436930 RepID=UPI002C62DC74|nr:hypothetical protein [Yinghuangia sp.]
MGKLLPTRTFEVTRDRGGTGGARPADRSPKRLPPGRTPASPTPDIAADSGCRT